jgi:hypothetical protein
VLLLELARTTLFDRPLASDLRHRLLPLARHPFPLASSAT